MNHRTAINEVAEFLETQRQERLAAAAPLEQKSDGFLKKMIHEARMQQHSLIRGSVAEIENIRKIESATLLLETRLEELSKGTLGAYVKKASGDLKQTSMDTGKAITAVAHGGDAKHVFSNYKKADKRLGGIGSAVKRLVKEALGDLDEGLTPKGHTIEAQGIRGMKRTPWRKTFKHSDHLNDWAEKNDSVEVHGTRDLESAKKGGLSPAIRESEELDEGIPGKQPKKANRFHITNKDGRPATLGSYPDRASAEKDRDEKFAGANVEQRSHTGKLIESDELDEGTLGRYIKKASGAAALHAATASRDKALKRLTGVETAADKLTKE
jgi:hypothetical protein